MLRPLQTLLELIGQTDRSPQLIFAGDYVNRGPHSRGVIDLLIKLENARFVRGNHDDVFDLILHGDCYTLAKNAIEPVAAFRWFIEQGLDQTLASYGIDSTRLAAIERRPSKQQIDTLFEVVPAAHRQFLRALEPVVEFDDCFVAHAYWSPDDQTDDPRIAARLEQLVPLRQHLVWTRFTDPQIRREKSWQRRGFFGHTPVLHYN